MIQPPLFCPSDPLPLAPLRGGFLVCGAKGVVIYCPL